MYSSATFSTEDKNLHEINLLHRDIRENSKKIDKCLMELRALERRLVAETELILKRNRVLNEEIQSSYRSIA